MHIGKFHLPILLPFRCLTEVLEGFSDLLILFRFANKKVWFGFHCADAFISELRSYGRVDLLDVDVSDRTNHVKIKLLLR